MAGGQAKIVNSDFTANSAKLQTDISHDTVATIDEFTGEYHANVRNSRVPISSAYLKEQ
jgi:hypothetical protein